MTLPPLWYYKFYIGRGTPCFGHHLSQLGKSKSGATVQFNTYYFSSSNGIRSSASVVGRSVSSYTSIIESTTFFTIG
jgi:hypothetical protein